jgi:2-C-methyl-D-erythritol 2,4-cyclodiphosphate synthase/2-C-methyl-D-erythritol 4-phosphate cytidylyltransferase
MKTSLILTCAGKGLRAGFEKNKLLMPVDGEICFLKALNVFIRSGKIDEYIITANKDDFDQIKSLSPDFVKIVVGGDTRSKSIENALEHVTGDIVLIHDGARPFLTENLVKDCINTVVNFGSAIPCVPSVDTIANVDGDEIINYIGKSGLYSIQTPQGFITKDIKYAYACAQGDTANDDGSLYLEYIKTPRIFVGEKENIKLTFKDDFDKKEVRFGTGFDCHKLVANRDLILGGIKIPHDKGLLGHSDADVLTHAIMDAILSGAGLRDIGYYFPDSDPKYKGADSVGLLREVLRLIKENGFTVKSVSAVIMAEKPKLLKHIPTIKDNLAGVLGLSVDKIGIGATTLEGLGFVGREEGICTHANVVLEK